MKEIKEGELNKYLISNSWPIFVFKPTKEQWNDLMYLDEHVWNTQYSGYDKENKIFIYWGISTRFGCNLEFMPKDQDSATAAWGRKWLGGYFDPCHESSYDLGGRTIKTSSYTYNGFNLEVQNLKVPTYEIRQNKLVIKLL